MSWLCCLNENRQKRDVDHYEFLAPSVFHLETSLMEQIEKAGLDKKTAQIYDIEDLRKIEHGVIRNKGANVQCPIDGKTGAAYVHCITGEDNVGTATHMLSYAWGYRVIDIVETLLAFCKENKLDPKKNYIWICCLCNNQHRVFEEEEVPFDMFQDVFNKRVTGIGNVLAMMAPWNDPSYLKRVWCIFEMYTANSDDKCSIQIVMPPKEKESLLESITTHAGASGRNGIDELFDALANTQVELAEASRETDKVNILKLVKQGPGYHTFNVEINQLMRKWIKDTVIESAKTTEAINCTNDDQRRQSALRLAFYGSYFSRNGLHKAAIELHEKSLNLYESLDTEDKDTIARCYNNIGTEYESMGEYENALEAHTKCLEIFEVIYGTDHPNTSVSYFNIGFVHRKLDDDDKALEMFTKSLEIDKNVKGENHIDTATSYTNLGRIKQKKGDLDGALEMFNKTLAINTDTYGSIHPETGIANGDIALVYHLRKDYDAAIGMHEKTLKIQEAVLGESHPDTAQVYQNIGAAFYEKKEFKISLEYLEKAKSVFEESLGSDHPKSVGGKAWVEVVEQARDKAAA